MAAPILAAWAAAHILIPAAEKAGSNSLSRMDPESRRPTSFGHWLHLSLQELQDAGRPFTIDPGRIRLIRSPSSTKPTKPMENQFDKTGSYPRY